LSIENYSINANTGVVDSEPNLKSAVGTSNGVTAVNPTRTEVTPTNNAQVLQIKSSSRFAVQLDLTGVSVAFVANERITDTASGNTALILAVDPEAAGLQTVYITDMNGVFDATPTTFTSATGSATGGTLTFRYRYSEKDPRKLVTTATFTISTGNNEQYFVAPGNGVADEDCEVSGIANNVGVGGTVSLSCTRVFEDGDIINFFLSSAGGSSTNFDKGIINIK
jgi:type II secretory pathway pseudopilin PulG